MVKTLDFIFLIFDCITTKSLMELEIRELKEDPDQYEDDGELMHHNYEDSLIFVLDKIIDEEKDEIPEFPEKLENLKVAHISKFPEAELDPVRKSHSGLVMEFKEVENVLLMTYKITTYDKINESFVEYNSGVINMTDLPEPRNIVSNYLTKFIISVLNSVGNDLSLLSEELHTKNRGSILDVFPLFLTNYRYFAKELLTSSYLSE